MNSVDKILAIAVGALILISLMGFVGDADTGAMGHVVEEIKNLIGMS